MSRIGRMPIAIPEGVDVTIQDSRITVKGPKGELTRIIHPRIKVEINNLKIVVKRECDEKLDKSLHGLTRVLIANMVDGVTKGYSKVLEISGVGYRVTSKEKKLIFQLGFSHQLEFIIPDGIDIKLEGQNIIVSGINKEVVGETAAKIRELKPVEPYKLKGIKYQDEKLRKKAGKVKVGAKQ